MRCGGGLAAYCRAKRITPHRCPLFGNPADLTRGPVALRPWVAPGLPLSVGDRMRRTLLPVLLPERAHHRRSGAQVSRQESWKVAGGLLEVSPEGPQMAARKTPWG